jgi:hypothetical protein
LHVIISKQASGPHARSRQFASFDQARHAAIDALVDAIEDAEAQLAALKRAGGCDDLAGRRAV